MGHTYHSPTLLTPLAAALALTCACSEEVQTEGPTQDSGPAAHEQGEPAGAPRAAARLLFTEQAAAAGLDYVNWCGSERDAKHTIMESIGQGAAWLDDDGDGVLDLFIVNGSSNGTLPADRPRSRYYRGVGNGRFEDVTLKAGVGDDAWGNGVAAADADGDGDTDLYVTNWGPNLLYRSDGEGRFRDVARAAGVDNARKDGLRNWSVAAAWGDVDRDGDLDLFVAHYLLFDPENPPHGGATQNWKGIREAYYGPLGCVPQGDLLFVNGGDGTFRDATESSGIATPVPAYTLGAIFTDVDLDGDADLYVANDSQPNYLFRNDGTGQFEERGQLMGLAYGEQGNPQAGMGVDAADFDRDGDDDLLVTNFDDDVNTLYRNEGGRSFRDITVQSGLAAPGRNLLCWGCGLVDFDNDADLDVMIVAGHVYPRAETDDPNTSYLQQNQLLANSGGRLTDVTAEAGPGFQVREVSRGAAFGDYDADGDVDAVVVNLNRPVSLLRNDTANGGAWLAVLLRGADGNTGAIGARVTVRADGEEWSAERRAGASFLSTNSPWLHFGLGGVEQVESVRVRWPSGAVTEHGPFEVDQQITIAQPGK